ncbi:MAG: hypothetical protein QNL04_03980 [SAR324 cluster bacterium]|nr:hypothetical protein [SAR324 cluster bacterium]
MSTEVSSIALIAIGVAITLVSSYQLYKSGFILWMTLLIVGVTGVNYGYNNQGANFDGFLNKINAGELTSFSKDKLEQVCASLEPR